MKVLIHFSHGLGDCVQLSVVLKHLRKHRPDWQIDVRCGRGKHSALVGLCNHVYHDQEEEPKKPYDSVVDLGWYENYNRYTDRPNSKVTNCLHEVFGMGYDPELGRYEVACGAAARHRARNYLSGIGAQPNEAGRFKAVAIHYQGNTSPSKKNLAHWQARALVDCVLAAGRVPVILDWDNRSPLFDQKTVFNPGCGGEDLWGSFGSGDAETIAALISQCEAMVGVDSGPGKVASSTDTPTLVCWKGHHPVQFHDPAPNTTHLVPAEHRRMSPAGDDSKVADYFQDHYHFITYSGEHGLVAEACHWLGATLGFTTRRAAPGVRFVLPNGIGDVMWALLKIQSIAAGRPIDLLLSGDPKREVDKRCLPFVKRFPFVRSAEVTDMAVLHDKENPANSRGRYHYVADGLRDDTGLHFLIPNAALEDGRRIEDWLPSVPVDYDVMKEFDWSGTERGKRVGQGMAPFVAFYLGPEEGNTGEGHNRDWLWEPRHWVELGHAMKERGHAVAVIGAPYDRSFWERYVKDGVREAGLSWVDLIGKFEIGETFALLKQAACLISYQCGLGIVTHYLGGKVAMWWRPEGNSVHPRHHISFNEAMKDAWVRPGWERNYLGLVYRRELPEKIISMIDERGWLK